MRRNVTIWVGAAVLGLLVLGAGCALPASKTETPADSKTSDAKTDAKADPKTAVAEVAPGAPVNQIGIAGVGGTVFAAIFAPNDVTVPVGSTLTWSNLGDWPHQVTFLGADGRLPELGQGQTQRTRPANITQGETVVYDGTNFLHSGLLARGQRIGVTFSREGTFKYLCPIHPRMEGTVKVVPKGAPYTTSLQASDTAKVQRDQAVALAEPNREVFTNLYQLNTRRDDGTTLWTVPVGPRVGTETGFLEVAEYLPADLKVRPGDSVRWYFFSGHMVTFLPPGEAVPAAQPPPSPSGLSYDGRSMVNSGTLSFNATEGLRSFEMKFPNAGTFPYICFLHIPEGQKGTITVAP